MLREPGSAGALRARDGEPIEPESYSGRPKIEKKHRLTTRPTVSVTLSPMECSGVTLSSSGVISGGLVGIQAPPPPIEQGSDQFCQHQVETT